MRNFYKLMSNLLDVPKKIRAMGIEEKSIYILKKRIECGDWKLIEHLFTKVTGTYIVTKPIAGRKYFTLNPNAVFDILKSKEIW